MTFVQLYGETLSDLLAGDAGEPAGKAVGWTEAAAARGGAGQGGAAVELLGATVARARSADELLARYRRGAAFRATGATNMNDASSRSHALFTMRVEGSGARFHVVDLAGSENVKRSGATGGAPRATYCATYAPSPPPP